MEGERSIYAASMGEAMGPEGPMLNTFLSHLSLLLDTHELVIVAERAVE